jgi:hypothetical protein
VQLLRTHGDEGLIEITEPDWSYGRTRWEHIPYGH